MFSFSRIIFLLWWKCKRFIIYHLTPSLLYCHLVFSLVFEFDLRNLTLDLCSAGLDYCRHSTTQVGLCLAIIMLSKALADFKSIYIIKFFFQCVQCVYRQYQEWPFDVANYLCQCKPGFYTDRPENVSNFLPFKTLCSNFVLMENLVVRLDNNP